MGMEVEEINETDLLKLWRPQAIQKVESGSSQLLVEQFFRSKGIGEAAARSAAEEIFLASKKASFWSSLPLNIIGWGLLLFGLFATLGTFFYQGRFYVVALGPVAMGAAIIWGGYRGGEE